jgi:hypothetical protein
MLFDRHCLTNGNVALQQQHCPEHSAAAIAPQVLFQMLLCYPGVNLDASLGFQLGLHLVEMQEEGGCEGVPMLLVLQLWRMKVL